MAMNIPQAILDIEIPEDDPGLMLHLPRIQDKKELSAYIKPMYTIHEYMKSDEEYDELKNDMYDLVKSSFEIKECREFPVKFKFYQNDRDIHTLQLRHFLINLFLWRPLIEVYPWTDVMNEDFIFDCFNNMTRKKLNEYLNEYPIKTLIDHNCKTIRMNRLIAETQYDLTSISNNFSSIMCLTFAMETFQHMWNQYPRYRELATTQYPSTVQPKEIEQDLAEKTKEMIKLFRDDPGNPIGYIFASGAGIKDKQFCEYTINGGCNPDLSGKTIPRALNTNTLMGIRRPSQLMIGAMGARKSLGNHNWRLKTFLIAEKISLCLNY